MKITHYLVLFAMILAVNACKNKEQKLKVNKEVSLVETYLGQKPPGLEPTLFAPEIIKTEFEDAYGSISPDGKYFFFHRSYGGDKADIFWVDAKIIFSLI